MNTSLIQVNKSSLIVSQTVKIIHWRINREIPVGRNITGWPGVFVNTKVLFVPCL